MEILAIVMVGALIVALAFLYFIYITSPQKNFRKRNHESTMSSAEISTKWAEVGAMMQAGGPANFKQSIMDADKLVDAALRSKVRGETMGERLKNARHLFSQNTYNDLWTAHKIRNKIAHESEFEGLSSDAVLAVRNFEKALKELRII